MRKCCTNDGMRVVMTVVSMCLYEKERKIRSYVACKCNDVKEQKYL